jgi:quercetin dioxygenase-like cupin family protein
MRTVGTLAVMGIVAMAGAGRSQTPPAAASHNNHVAVSSAGLRWRPLRPGAETAVVSGDPAKAGPFVMRFRYRGAARIPPHWHPNDEHITVLSGTFIVGMGETYDDTAGTELPAGGYARLPAKMPHYARTNGDAVIQVHGDGPFTINYLNPADDPARATKK